MTAVSYRFRLEAILTFILGLVLFTLQLGPDVFIHFNSRFAQFAREMLQHGVSFFPTLDGKPYPDYPGTATILMYLFSLPFGHLTKLSAVLPSAIAAALTLSFTYLTGALLSRKWGIVSVLFLLFTWNFFSSARNISLDLYVAFVTTLIFYLCFSAHLSQRSPSWKNLFLILLTSFIFRGPFGVVIPTGVIFVLFMANSEWKLLAKLIAISVSALIIGVSVLLFCAFQQGGEEFLYYVIHMQLLSRFEDHANNPFYFYFTNSFGMYAITFPLAVITTIGLLPQLCKRTLAPSLKLLQAACLWALIIMIGMSIPHDKKPRYILSIAPAISLISAYLIAGDNLPKFLLKFRNLFIGFCFIFPAIGIVLLQILQYLLPILNLSPDIHFTGLTITLGILQLLALVIAKTRKQQRDVLLLAIAVATFVIITIFAVEPVVLSLATCSLPT